MVRPMSGPAPDIQRLIGDLIRPARVVSVDYDAQTCTVEMGDIITGDLPFMAVRAGRIRIWLPPAPGEQVSLFCPEGDTNAGIVGPALYCDDFPAPSSSPDVAMVAFDDDSSLSYDMAAHHLGIDLPAGSASINAPGGLSITGPVSITGDITLDGSMDSSGDVTASGISLKSHKHGQVQAGGAQSGGPV